jgi:hypothetical protein
MPRPCVEGQGTGHPAQVMRRVGSGVTIAAASAHGASEADRGAGDHRARTRRPALHRRAAALKGRDTNRLFVYRKEGAMGKLMKQAEKFAKSPKAKDLEKKMLRKAKDPETRAKISKRFGKLRKKA